LAATPFKAEPKVDADPTTGLILAYGEFFGFHRFVCLLGEKYGAWRSERPTRSIREPGKISILASASRFRVRTWEDIYAYKRTRPEDIKRGRRHPRPDDAGSHGSRAETGHKQGFR
jgi:hypothetical protein